MELSAHFQMQINIYTYFLTSGDHYNELNLIY